MKFSGITKKKAINISLYVLGIFVFQEIVFRYAYPVPELSNFDRSIYLNLGTDTKSDFLRNIDFTWKSLPDTNKVFVHEMNRYGFRDEEWLIDKPIGTKRVVFIGDSFIEGVMAKQKETIPEYFKKASPEKLEVYNAGILGVGLKCYLQLAADMIPIFKPDVVFMCIYANDLGKEEPTVPEFFLEPEYYNSWTPRLYTVVDQMTSNGSLLPRWKEESKPYFLKTPDKSNPWSENEELLRGSAEPWLEEAMIKAELNPFLVNAFQKEEIHLKEKPKLGETIPFFQYTCQKYGATPIVVYIPSRNQVTKHYYPYELEMCKGCSDEWDLTSEAYNIHQKTIANQCKQLGVQFIDLTNVVKTEEAKGNHLYWNYDQHMRAKGYKVLGEAIEKLWFHN